MQAPFLPAVSAGVGGPGLHPGRRAAPQRPGAWPARRVEGRSTPLHPVQENAKHAVHLPPVPVTPQPSSSVSSWPSVARGQVTPGGTEPRESSFFGRVRHCPRSNRGAPQGTPPTPAAAPQFRVRAGRARLKGRRRKEGRSVVRAEGTQTSCRPPAAGLAPTTGTSRRGSQIQGFPGLA